MTLSIVADWKELEAGPPEERACFAAVGIQANDIWLTEADDSLADKVLQKVYLSGYHLAEWLAWNWWRLRWEPRARSHASQDWLLAHRLTTIGGGYVWPNLTLFSDGQRIALYSRPTRPSPAESLRYICDTAVVLAATDFEQGLDEFFDLVRERLIEKSLQGTNLQAILADLEEDRADPERSRDRRLEAILGFDPDDAPASLIERLSEESAALGRAAVEELAADRFGRREPWTSGQLEDFAGDFGISSRLSDHVKLTAFTGQDFKSSADKPAWELGAKAAHALRVQEKLGSAPLSNKGLAEFLAMDEGALTAHDGPPISFSLDRPANQTAVVLRQSNWQTSRRFDAARLLGDRFFEAGGGRLFPATRSYTYRQKWQRAFAAELLCPYEALRDSLEGDLSDERLEAAAQHFGVSDLAVQTSLVNHGDLPRSAIDAADAA